MKSNFHFWLFIRELRDSAALVELLGHSSMRLFGDDLVHLRGAVEEGLSQRLQKWPARQFGRFTFFKDTEVRPVTIDLPYQQRTFISDQDKSVVIPAIVSQSESKPRWRISVPSLDLSIFFHREKELETSLPKEILKALRRKDLIHDLRTLSLGVLAPCDWELEQTSIFEQLPTLDSYLKNKAGKAPAKTPELDEVSDQVSKLLREHQSKIRCYEREAEIDRLESRVKKHPPRSVVLVGPRGVGKTAVFFEWARRHLQDSDNQRVLMTTGSQIVAGMSAMGQIEERCQKIMDEAKREKVILHAGPLLELLYSGRHSGSALGVASLFKEAVARGEMILVLEATSEEWLKADELDPGFVSAIDRIDVELPSQSEALRTLLGVSDDATQDSLLTISKDAVADTLSLHQRFSPYASIPGRCVRFLLDLVASHPVHTKPPAGSERQPVEIQKTDIALAFSKQTGLPLWLLQDQTKLIYNDVHKTLKLRVMGQDHAVESVSQLLCRVKAGLTEATKPLMSLLFVGPTGVGKTEMAKALAEFVFSNQDRLLRFDMSEYSNPIAVARLTGAHGSGEGLLTRKLRENPFAVVLFDELEKADTSFFDLLLQILGDGRLSDAKGIEANFRHAVIIMTSNLGAVAARQGSLGFDKTNNNAHAQEQQLREHYLEAAEREFRPELLNRLDAIIPFLSLPAPIIRQITDRELTLLLTRDGILRHELAIEMPDDVRQWLANKGFDPAYGARPLKRTLETKLALPLAEALGKKSKLRGRAVQVSLNDDNLEIVIGAPPSSGNESQRPLSELAQRCSSLRRRLWQVKAGKRYTRMRNDHFMLQRKKRRSELRRRSKIQLSPQELAVFQRLDLWFASFDKTIKDVEELEELVLHALLSGKGQDDEDFLKGLEADHKAASRSLLLDLVGFNSAKPNKTVLIFHGPHDWLKKLLASYLSLAKDLELTASITQRVVWSVNNVRKDQGLPSQFLFVQMKPIDSVEDLSPPQTVKGVSSVALELHGRHAFAMFQREIGSHRLNLKNNKRSQSVQISRLSKVPDCTDTANWNPGQGGLVREYFQASNMVTDKYLKVTKPYTTMSMPRVIRELLEARLDKSLAQDSR